MSSAVVIGIPTYRRPALLATLLDSLAPEIAGHDVLVVVGDNDSGNEAPSVVAGHAPGAVCVPVPRPGISEVRNELVRTATRERPDWEHLIMLDDDGFVTKGWFGSLMAAVAAYDADVTGGPVLGSLPAGASLLARSSEYAGRRRQASGPVTMLNGAQNIAISRRILDRIGDPWFPVRLGRTGGEDYYLFRDVLARGGSLAWCDEAAVVEPTPAERLTSRALLRRAFRSNYVAAQVDRSFDGRGAIARRLVTDSYWATRVAATGVVRRDPERLSQCILWAACLAGRASALTRRELPQTSHTGL